MCAGVHAVESTGFVGGRDTLSSGGAAAGAVVVLGRRRRPRPRPAALNYGDVAQVARRHDADQSRRSRGELAPFSLLVGVFQVNQTKVKRNQ